MDINGKIGTLLKEYRKKGGFSLSDMGFKLSVAPTLIARWERGKTNLTLDTIVRFTDALGYEPEIIFKEKSKPKKKS